MGKAFRQYEGTILQSEKESAREMLEHVIESCQCEGKQCTKCRQVKCIRAFGPGNKSKDGLHYHCRLCKASAQRKYAIDHLDRVKTQQKAYNQSHREQNREKRRQRYQREAEQSRLYGRTYYHAHIEERRAYSRYYHHTYRDRCIATMHNRYQQHIEFHRSYARQASRRRWLSDPQRWRDMQQRYRTENPDRILAQRKSYRQRYAEQIKERERVFTHRRRALKRNGGGTYTASQWNALKVQYDYTCFCCGRKEPEIKLTVDHVIPLICHGSNSIENLQPLCFSCNCRKGRKIIDYRKGWEEKNASLQESHKV